MERAAEIWVFLESMILGDLNNRKLDGEQTVAGIMKMERKVNEGTLRLGSTDIKMGQVFSTKSDIVPEEL